MSRIASCRTSTGVVAAIIVLAACGRGSEGESSPATDPPLITESAAETTDLLTADPSTSDGDDARTTPECGAVVNSDDDAIDEYAPVACDEPHDAEFAGLASTSFESAIADDPEPVSS
jgi:hypothetical protein